MDLHTRIGSWLGDDRLLTNLVGLHILLAAILVVSVVLRKLLIHGGDQLARWTGLHWLEGFSREAVRRTRSFLFWSTLGLMTLAVLSGILYHMAGRDIRSDLTNWYNHLTAAEIFNFGVALGQLVLLGVGVYFGLRLVRRARRGLQDYALNLLPHKCPLGLDHLDADGRVRTEEEHKERHERTIKHWFHLLERFALCTVILTGVWIGGHIVRLTGVVDQVVGFSIRMLAIFMVARLLTLACRTISHSLAELGNRHLGTSQFQRYWERVTRLFPFGEKCFEAAIYISAASLCVRELAFIAVIADLGPRLVQCIGIFFVTRVLIELLSVLLNEAFGMYDDDRVLDQKGQTLVPLLQSISQYVLYFGSGLIMLGVLGVDTRPILAGAGILGLAGGLGAQSLVTDVVSGFFILFENQYLVGDIVQIGDAQGRVEAVSIRHTQIRDEHGKLFIIPNGQVKSVINFSKGYVNAVVDLKVPTSTPLHQVLHDMAEAGRRLRVSRREVLAETVVKGLVDLTPSDMVVRAVTRVHPGTHLAMQNEFRRLLKEVFEERMQKGIGLAA